MGFVSKYQIFSLATIATIGGTTIFCMASSAKNDAWLAIILAFLIAMVFVWFFTKLQDQYPDKNYIEIITEVLGKPLGIPLSLLYIMHFIYQCSRSYRDYTEFISSTFLENTPRLVIMITSMLLMCYVIYLGYETLTRTTEILNPIFIFFLISVYFLIVFTGKVDLSNIKPVLANGLAPVLKAAFPGGVIFPFAETALIFLMFFKYSKEKQGLFKIFFYSYLVSTILIVISTTVIICTLGLEYGSTVVAGLVEVIKNINIADVLTNLDAIGIIMLFIGVFYKTIIYLLGAVLAFSTLFGIKNYRWVIIPVGIVVTWYSTVFEPNYPYHLWLGFYVTINYIHPIFVLSMPVLILLVAFFKRKTDKCSKKLPA